MLQRMNYKTFVFTAMTTGMMFILCMFIFSYLHSTFEYAEAVKHFYMQRYFCTVCCILEMALHVFLSIISIEKGP